jgi:hypothetical protein
MDARHVTDRENFMDDLEAVRQIATILEEFEDQEKTRIIRWTLERAGIEVPLSGRSDESRGGTLGFQPPGSFNDIKSFYTAKNPNSDNQFAAVVAYFYAFEANPNESKKTITSADLTDACRKVNRPRLGDPVKTLSNAHVMCYFDKVGKGEYKLNTVGENLVAMTLPAGSGESSRTVKKATRKKAVKKKAVKKPIARTKSKR